MWYELTKDCDPLLHSNAERFGEALEWGMDPSEDCELIFVKEMTPELERFSGIRIGVDVSLSLEFGKWDYLVREPFDRESLVRIAKTLCGRPVDSASANAETACLNALSVPTHLLGFRYLHSAVRRISRETHPLQASMMHDVYPEVAEEYGSSSIMVNRAIRHAIDSAWKQGESSVQRSYFGYCANDKKGVPTNVEFLFAVVERMRILKGS